MKNIVALILSTQLIGCSSLSVDLDSEKAQYNPTTATVAWNKKAFSPHWLTRQYETEKMFLDDEVAQEKMKEVRELSKKSNAWGWSGIGAAVTYLFFLAPERTEENNSQVMTTYWGIFLIGFVGSLHYFFEREELIEETVKDYNERKGYTFSPYIYREREARSLGLALSSTF